LTESAFMLGDPFSSFETSCSEDMASAESWLWIDIWSWRMVMFS
jgi:hypothetical protein